jgi:hypothetical protein
VLCDIGTFAMIAPQCWQLCEEISVNTLANLQREWEPSGSAFEKADKYPSAAYTYVPMNFYVRIGNLFPNSQQL